MNVIPWERELHGGFTFTAVRGCASEWPYATPGADQAATARWLVDQVRRCTVSNPSGCWVAVDEPDPDVVLGVMLSPGPQRVAWAYTRHAIRRHGIASKLAMLVGIDFSQPTYLSIWTYAASRIAARGYRLIPEIPEEENSE